jgi:hypothetical protein
MKTLPIDPLKDKLEKEEMINSFAEALHKHTSTSIEAWNVIHTISETSEFVANQLWEHESIVNTIRIIEDAIKKDPLITEVGNWRVRHLNNAFLECVIMSGQSSDGLNILSKMKDSFEEILS